MRHSIFLSPLSETILKRVSKKNWGFLSRYISTKLIQDFSGDIVEAQITYLKELINQKKKEIEILRLECKVAAKTINELEEKKRKDI